MSQQRSSANDAGFTLIEVLVAFVVLAIALSGVYATLADSARLQSHVASRDAIMAEAMSHLDRLVVGPLVVGESAGRFADGFTWQARVVLLARYGGSADASTGPAHVTLMVRNGGNRIVATFETVALTARAP